MKKKINWNKDTLRTLSEEWDFHFLRTMPNLTYHFVALVKLNKTGDLAIIKLGEDAQRIAAEAYWLRKFTQGVPKIYQVDESKGAFLMEYIEPGIPLTMYSKEGKDEMATRILCQTIRTLQSNPQSESHFKHLSDLQRFLPILKWHFNDQMLVKAQALFHELTVDRSGDILLHGDLHHDNILSSGLSWKVIDPHGYVGDPAFEIGAMIYNPQEFFHQPILATIEKRLKILAEELSFDPQRIKGWAFCMTILSIAWAFEEHGKIPAFKVQVASAIDQIQV